MVTEDLRTADYRHRLSGEYVGAKSAAVIYLDDKPVLYAERSSTWRAVHLIAYVERHPHYPSDVYEDLGRYSSHTLGGLLDVLAPLLARFDQE